MLLKKRNFGDTGFSLGSDDIYKYRAVHELCSYCTYADIANEVDCVIAWILCYTV